VHRKKRAFELARQPSATKMTAAENRVRVVRTRGGNKKYRALRLANGNFAWTSAGSTNKCRILDVVYNATSNELVRTKTLVQGCIVQVDAAPFKHWYYRHYGVILGKKTTNRAPPKKKDAKNAAKKKAVVKVTGSTKKPVPPRYGGALKELKNPSKYILKKWSKRAGEHTVDKLMENQFRVGRLLAKLTSRPGQVGRADGRILEGAELRFYQKKMDKKKKRQ